MSTNTKAYAQLVVAFAPLIAMIVLIGFCLRRETKRADDLAEIKAERQAFWDDADRFAMVGDKRDQEDSSPAALDRIWELEGPER